MSHTEEKTKKHWQFTSTELQKALDIWGELSQKPTAPSPDEEMLQNMQKLLKDLRHQIDELSDEKHS